MNKRHEKHFKKPFEFHEQKRKKNKKAPMGSER